ncbi:MAG: SRPBCC domain-containing protein [Phycisphaerales bacterium]
MKTMAMVGVVLALAGAGAWGQGQQGGSALLRGEDAASSGTRAAAAAVAPQVVEQIVAAPPEELWRVFTTGEGFTKLGVAKAEVDLRVGGLMRSHYRPEGVIGDEGTIENQIIAYEPLRMIAFRIHKPPAGFPFKEAWKGTWSVATFTDLGDGRTHLRLAGLGYTDEPESRAMREFFEKGNAWTLEKLASQYDAAAKAAPPAEAHKTGALDPIELEAVVPGTREEVWRAYTTGEGWKKFFGVETRIGGGPGEPFEVYFGASAPMGERGSEGCVILSLVPGEMFSYTWNAPPKFAQARKERTWVVVTFEEVSARATRVRVRHMGFAERAAAHGQSRAEWEQVRAYFANAWPHVLGALKKSFEGAASGP